METSVVSLTAFRWGWEWFCAVQYLVCGAARRGVYEGIHTKVFLYIKHGLTENYLNTSIDKKNPTFFRTEDMTRPMVLL